MMTLDKITTPFERRRVIEYGKDGNKVVRHWYEVQHVIGTLYKTKETKNEWGDSLFNLVIFFDNKSDGLMFERMSHPERYTVERVADTMRRYQIDSVTHMYIGLNDRMEQNKFIGAADIEFFRQFDRAAAERYAQHRLDYYARKEAEERERRRVVEEQEAAEKARQQAELEAAKAKYFGWADTMTPMHFGKVDAVLGSLIRCDGKVMTRREFVIQAIKDGWTPEQKDGVTSWYGSKWEPKQSKPRTEYRLVRENFSYKVSKTEFDFAKYYVEHMGV